MAKPRVSAGGGLPAIFYVWKKAREAGGVFRLYRRLRSKNACKTCAFGMGGSRGGMVNEAGEFPEFCKKSVQAQAGDMAGTIPEEFFATNTIESLSRFTSAECERHGRLAFPIIAGEGDSHFRRISWDEAIDHVADAFGAAHRDRTFFYASGRSSNEAAFLLQLVARAYGSPHITNCSDYCHAASGVALTSVYGSGTASVTLSDMDETELVILAGANPASNHPRVIKKLVELRRRGGKVIVINPMRELGLERFRVPSDWHSMLFGSTVNDLYLQPNVGSDIALLKAILIRIVERGAVDQQFIDQHTSGWEEVVRDLDGETMDRLVDVCGVPQEQIDRAATLIGSAKKGLCLWAMGLTHHEHGVDNVLALTNLALARGWLGQHGAGLMPIRGHSNVQGVASVGMTPTLKKSFKSEMERLFPIQLPDVRGRDTYSSMRAADAGDLDAALLLGGNLWGSNPDQEWAGAAMRKIALTFSLTTQLNQGHFQGRGKTAIIVPVLARDEEPQPTTQESMFNYVRLSEGGVPALTGDMRSEVSIISSLAAKLLPEGRFDWKSLRSHRELRKAISATVPGYAAAEAGGDAMEEFQIDGRTFHEPRFATDNGRARFHVTSVPARDKKDPDSFVLMTLRSEGQFNSVVYEEEDLLRGNKRRDVVMMSADDAERLGLSEGEWAVVTTEIGRMKVSVSLSPLPRGSLAMYYPEANKLVPRRIDPRSGTPAFKSIAAKVERAHQGEL